MKADYPYSPRPFAPQVIEGGYRSKRAECIRHLLVRVGWPAGLLGIVVGYLLGRWL